MAGQGQGGFFKRKHEVPSTVTGVTFTSGSPPAGGSIVPPPPGEMRSPPSPPVDIRPAPPAPGEIRSPPSPPVDIRPAPPPPSKILLPLHAQVIATKRPRVDNSDGSCGRCICGGCICSSSLCSSTSAGALLRWSNQLNSQPGVEAVALERCDTLENFIGSVPATSLCIKIPNKKYDLIIGEGYDNINWMQSKSGASILLLPRDISGETTMHINGKPENVKIAKELVDTILSEGYYCPPLNLGYPGRPPKKVLGHAYMPAGGAEAP